MRRLAAMALLAVVLAGCGGLKKGGLTPVGDDEATKAPSEARESATVTMVSINYKPETIRIRPGGTVTWVNRDKVAHTVTEGDELYNRFNSGDVGPGKSYSRKFTKERKIGYRCTIHPNMEGIIFVGEGR
jgi:plastocyanin